MTTYDQPGDNLAPMKCETCKNMFWVPDYGVGNEVLSAASYCPFCGIKFDKVLLDVLL